MFFFLITENLNSSFFKGALLLDWFSIHFEGRLESSTLFKQFIMKFCTCLISLGVLRVENAPDNQLFQVRKITIFFLFCTLFLLYTREIISRFTRKSNSLFSCLIRKTSDLYLDLTKTKQKISK